MLFELLSGLRLVHACTFYDGGGDGGGGGGYGGPDVPGATADAFSGATGATSSEGGPTGSWGGATGSSYGGPSIPGASADIFGGATGATSSSGEPTGSWGPTSEGGYGMQGASESAGFGGDQSQKGVGVTAPVTVPEKAPEKAPGKAPEGEKKPTDEGKVEKAEKAPLRKRAARQRKTLLGQDETWTMQGPGQRRTLLGGNK